MELRGQVRDPFGEAACDTSAYQGCIVQLWPLGDAPSLSLSSCWLIYLAACLLVLLSGVLLWPHAPFARDADPGDSVHSAADDDALFSEPLPFRAHLASRPFCYLTVFAASHILRLNFVVGTFQVHTPSPPRRRLRAIACAKGQPTG